MAHIIALHSFRGGTGKSNITANLATLLAAEGYRVGIVDTDIQSPGIHALFNLSGAEISYTLNDFLWGKCSIQQATLNVTNQVEGKIPGQLLLVPSNMKSNEAITRVLTEGYDANLLTIGLRNLIRELQLDILMLDTHPGLNKETLLAIVIAHLLVIILRPDQQDYEGTDLTVQVARKLDVPDIRLLVNNIPTAFDMAAVKAKVEQTYNCDVLGVLPHADEMMTLASTGLFVLRYPQHPMTVTLKAVAADMMAHSPH